MSKVKWDSFDRVAVIVTPTGLSDVFSPSWFMEVYISGGSRSVAESELRYHAAELPVAFKDPWTNAWVELFESEPGSIDIHIECDWGWEDPLTMDVELRLMDADGNDALVGTQSVDRSHFSSQEFGPTEAVITFDTSGMFGAGEDTGAAGNYLFRTGDMPGVNLPPPEPLPPPASPLSSRPPTDYRPPRPTSIGTPRRPTGDVVLVKGFVLTQKCSYDNLNTGFGNGLSCYWVRVPHENLYYFKDQAEFWEYSDRFEGMKKFKDPARAGYSEPPLYELPKYAI